MKNNYVVRDTDGVELGIATLGPKTIAPNQRIPWRAIKCQSPLTVYFDDTPAKTWTFDPGELIPIHFGIDMRLSTEALCLVY